MTSHCPSVRSLRVPEDPLRTTFLYGEISDRKQHIVEGQSSRTRSWIYSAHIFCAFPVTEETDCCKYFGQNQLNKITSVETF